MREDVRQALAIDASSTMEDRTIHITTTGRRSVSLTSSSKNSTVVKVRTVPGRKPFSMIGWNTALWRRSLSNSDLVGPISCFKPRCALFKV